MATFSEFFFNDPTYFEGGIHNWAGEGIKEELPELIQSPKDEAIFYNE